MIEKAPEIEVQRAVHRAKAHIARHEEVRRHRLRAVARKDLLHRDGVFIKKLIVERQIGNIFGTARFAAIILSLLWLLCLCRRGLRAFGAAAGAATGAFGAAVAVRRRV